MAILSKHNDVFTVMVEFHTRPETQDEVVAALQDLAGMFPSQPGFVSQHFHRSHDGERVVSYVQWHSERDHHNCRNNPELRSAGAALGQLMQSGKAEMHVRTYEIVASDESPRQSGKSRAGSGAPATKDLVLRYFNSRQRKDWDTMRACLADELDLEGPGGPGAMSADAFTAMCAEGSPWREVELIDSMFEDGHASLLYQGIDTKSESRVRIGEFVTVKDGKVAKMRGAFALGGSEPPVA